MLPLFLDSVSFWDVIWWLVIVFFAFIAIWIFIALVADIFGRRDLSGWGKAAWLFFIFILPIIGSLCYLIFRPAGEVATGFGDFGGSYSSQASAADEIAKAQQLLQSGAITQAEFDQIKRRALG